MDAQFIKQNAGWGEQDSLTSDLDKKKAEQQGARDETEARDTMEVTLTVEWRVG
jgi:hypothetical protein